MLDMQPPGEGYPIDQRRHLMAEEQMLLAASLSWQDAAVIAQAPLW